jgi:hypothetical protein
MTLTPPQAYVTFGLAGMVKNGVDIVRSATVKLVSLPPPMAKVVPLWLPSGCGYGPVDGDIVDLDRNGHRDHRSLAAGNPQAGGNEHLGGRWAVFDHPRLADH